MGRRPGARPRATSPRLIRAGPSRWRCASRRRIRRRRASAAARASVARAVVRVITPGTLTEDGLLDARRPNYLRRARSRNPGRHGRLALAVDISTGDLAPNAVRAELASSAGARIEPGELLRGAKRCSDRPPSPCLGDCARPADATAGRACSARPSAGGGCRCCSRRDAGRLRLLPAARWRRRAAVDRTSSWTHKGRRPPHRAAATAGGGLGDADRRGDAAQPGADPDARRRTPRAACSPRSIAPSPAAAPGCCGQRLAAPLTDPAASTAGSTGAASLPRTTACARTRGALAPLPDLERALGRLSLGRGGPRDLAAVRDGLAGAGELRALIEAGAALTAGRLRHLPTSPPP